VLPPTDYPKDSDNLTVNHSDITYAALLDRAAAEQPITDEMIRAACLKMEAAQQFPFAANDEVDQPLATQLLTKLRSVKPD